MKSRHSFVIAMVALWLSTPALAGTYYEARIDADQKGADQSIQSWVDGGRASSRSR